MQQLTVFSTRELAFISVLCEVVNDLMCCWRYGKIRDMASKQLPGVQM